MSYAKQAFVAVRTAQAGVERYALKLNQLQALKREVLGWNSPVANFRKYADEQIADLPRGDKQKKILRRQKADLSVAVNTLRDAIRTAESVNRMNRAQRSDNKTAIRAEKAIKQASDAFDRLIGCDRQAAIDFANELLARATVVDETPSEETVEITD